MSSWCSQLNSVDIPCSETVVQRGVKQEKKWGKESSSEDELEKEAKERIADLKERDEYANRVRDRDKERTKKVMSKSEQKVHNIV